MKFRPLVRELYWNSDAAGAFVLGQLAPLHGRVEIPRFGFWTSLWWLMATRHLPGHARLWEATGYLFAIATGVLVGWATWQVAGRWAGLTAAAVAVLVGPATLNTLLTVNWHTSTPFTAAVLAAYLVFIRRSRSWILAVAVGLLAGLNAASDPLLWVAGLAPFALAVALLALKTKERDIAFRGGVVLALAGVSVYATDRLMSALGFHVISVVLQLAPLSDVFWSFVGLGKSISLVFGANHFFPGIYPNFLLRYFITLFAFAALAATLLLVVRLTRRRAEATLWAYGCYWAAAALLLGLSAWLTNGSTGGGSEGSLNYLLTLAPAAGVGLALLATGSQRGRLGVSLAVAVVGATNIAGIVSERSKIGREPPYAPQVIRWLEREGLSKGYAPYWDASSLTWKSSMRLLVAPVQPCFPRQVSTAICPFRYFTLGSWYEARSGRSFLIVDPGVGLSARPRALGRPLKTFRPGPGIAVYVYPYDIAPKPTQ